VETGRRIPGQHYPDIQYQYHRPAKVHGWTPGDVCEVDCELLDWLIAIQGLEAEIEEEQRRKQEREMRKASQTRRR